MYLKRKYQVGGIAYTPYLPAQIGSPQESTSSSGGTSKSSTPEKISGTIKGEIVNLLKENGIPTDVSTFLNAANTFLDKSKSLSQMSLFGGKNDDYDLSDLIKIQQLVNDVKYNNNLRNKAVEHVAKEAAGSEVAITDNGHIYVRDENGNVSKIRPSEFKENQDKYVAMTNDQLLYLREHDPNFAFDTSTLNDLQNTIGMSTITRYLRDTITAFGSDKVGGYTTKNDSVNKGLALLTEMGPDGYYQFTSEEQLRDINRALRYLYDGMSENAKNLLKAKTAVEGGDPTNANDVTNLIWMALNEHTSRNKDVKFDKPATEYDPYQTKKKGGSGSSSEQLTQDNYLQQIGNMRLYQTTASIVPQASQVWESGALTMNVYSAGAPVDKNMEVLGPMNMIEFRQKAAAVKAGDLNSITFGNRMLDPNELPAIMYDGNSELNIAMLPYKHDPATGKVMPDFDKIAAYNEIQKILRDNPNISQMELDQILNDRGVRLDPNDYDRSTNTLQIKDTMPFITFSAYASRDSVNISKDMKPFLEHLSNGAGKQVMDAYVNALKYNTTTPSKSSRVVNKHFNSPERWDMYRGNVYIPMENAARAMLLSGIGEFVPKSEMTDFAARVTAREAEAEMTNYLRQNDPNYSVISQQLGQFR